MCSQRCDRNEELNFELSLKIGQIWISLIGDRSGEILFKKETKSKSVGCQVSSQVDPFRNRKPSVEDAESRDSNKRN